MEGPRGAATVLLAGAAPREPMSVTSRQRAIPPNGGDSG